MSETPSISKPSKCSTTSTTYLSMLKQLSKNVMVASSQGTTKSSAATVVFGMRWSTSSSRLTGCKGRAPKQNESDDKTVMKCVMSSMRPKQTQDSTINHQQPSTTLNNPQQPSTTINTPIPHLTQDAFGSSQRIQQRHSGFVHAFFLKDRVVFVAGGLFQSSPG